jgi:phage recombination protein Bet
VKKAKTKPKRKANQKTKPVNTAIVAHDTGAGVARMRQTREREQLELVKQTCCKGASDDEFRLFMWVAKKHRLDPLTRQLHAVFRNVTKHHQDEKGIWVPGKQMTIQIGIDGYRAMAARYPDYGSISEPEFEFTKPGDKFPVCAKVKVWKKNFEHPTVGVAFWDEYAPNLEIDSGFFWKKMPKGQLAKCAEALALRKAYPELSDIYVDDEMHQHSQDFTPGGRQITDEHGFAPSGRAVTFDAQKQGQIAEEVERQKAGALPSTPQKPVESLPGASWKREADKKADMPPIDVKPSQAQPERQWNGTVEVDFTDDPNMPYIRGDIAEVAAFFPRDLVLRRQNDFWVAFKEDVVRIKMICDTQGFKVEEIRPKQVSPAPKEAMRKPEEATVLGGSGGKVEGSAAPAVVAGIINQANPESGKVPRVSVLLKIEKASHWMSAFDTALFPFLIAGKGQEAEVFVTKTTKGDKTFTNIIGLKRIGSKHFDTDGKTPVIQRSEQQAGQKTLYG